MAEIEVKVAIRVDDYRIAIISTRQILRNIKVQPQSAPPDCGFSTSATPKAFGAVSLQVTLLLLQNCNDWQDKFLREFYRASFPRDQLYDYNLVTAIVAAKSGETGSQRCYRETEGL